MYHSPSQLPVLAIAAVVAAIAAAEPAVASQTVQSKTVKINGVELFYREAGPSNAPTVLLLHGFPSSSHMFRNLIPQLSERYHVIAPDYPGFGHTVAPANFSYTFASVANLIDTFTQTIGVKQYTLFVQDYGGPVGFRLAVKHPERLQGLVIQNAVANVKGWNPDAVKQFAPFWKERNAETEKPIRALLTADTTRFQYEHGTTRPQNLSPDAWTMDQAGLDRPGNDAIQLGYLFDYQNNVAAYPAWGELLKKQQPPTLIVWGRNDPFFTMKGVEYFRNLLPQAVVHDYDAGHFALETYGDEIAAETLNFLDALPRR
ncbi:alpha/beta hydrolase [Rhizobium sp. S95]|uniref:Alpha/beta hydrolase n=1 Tax=Ciceribacter sichuanensis TaxID=2949647 RepID=A0AAJ1C0D6_9HYPH|nr:MULTISPECIES: alpha/beta hydrolase [unclassified Ciceribacter]MCM2395864.1 alpha/beta hydrolase [Ciceribacter sp. S95]MCO5959533.1 alpha/beta hydrolase [Ciceribacter sp. S101]